MTEKEDSIRFFLVHSRSLKRENILCVTTFERQGTEYVKIN